MKTLVSHLPLFLAISLAVTFTSCQKERNIADDSISAEDQSNVSAALNATTDDASNAVGEMEALSGKTEGAMSACGFSIDSSNKSTGVIVLNYDGTTCTDISRTGSITITLQNYPTTRWADQGAVLTLAYNNLKVTNTKTAGYFTLSGTHTLTNVTGGLAWKIMLNTTGTVTHRHTASNFTIQFADGSVRQWNVDRLRTFNNSGSVRTVTVSSDHTEGNMNKVDAWGTNRNGVAFVNSIPVDIMVTSANTQCGGLWYNRPASGRYTHEIGNRSVQVDFGVNAAGNPVSGGNCPYGYKITYTKDSRSLSRVVSYWF